MEHKSLNLESVHLKFDETGRKFNGYASVFGGLDSYGDTIAPGAYAKTIVDRQRPVQMRWNHHGPIIGKWTSISEDEKGLHVEGELTPGHSVADDAYALLKHGAVTGLSIGYRIPKGGAEKQGNGLLLRQIDLVEISIVESPADNSAHVGEVKAQIEQAESLKDIEKFLRDDKNFSRSDATALVARIKTLIQSDSDIKTETAAIAGLFQQITIPQIKL